MVKFSAFFSISWYPDELKRALNPELFDKFQERQQEESLALVHMEGLVK